MKHITVCDGGVVVEDASITVVHYGYCISVKVSKAALCKLQKHGSKNSVCF